MVLKITKYSNKINFKQITINLLTHEIDCDFYIFKLELQNKNEPKKMHLTNLFFNYSNILVTF